MSHTHSRVSLIEEFKHTKIDWVTTLFITIYHVLLFIALPIYLMATSPGWPLIGFTLFLMAGSLLSITTGYHRLYAHRTYRTRKPVEWILVFFGTLATQGSVIRWSHDHRLHHSHLDSEKDPYGTDKGFWHSHLLWMFKDHVPLEERYYRDLKENKLLMFQHKYYGWLMAATNILMIIAAGFLTGDWFGAVVISFLLRLFLVHHSTWFINSLAHMWGTKPYSTEHSAVNNFILAILTYGEGYHNYHHTFASDYRNGIRWWQFDPPKYIIWGLSKLGLASDLKRADALMIKKKLVQADRKLLIEHLEQVPNPEAGAFKHAVENLAEKVSETIVNAKTQLEAYRALKREGRREDIKKLRREIRRMKNNVRQDMKTWRRLTRLILKLQPATA